MKKLVALLICLVLAVFLQNALSAKDTFQNNVVATVNGRRITQEDIAGRLENFNDIDAETVNTMKQEIIDQLITDILLDDFIDKQGLLVTQKEIETEVDQIGKNITGNDTPDVRALEQVLISIGSNLGEFKKSIKHSIALEKYFHNKLDDKTLEKFFEENQNIFNGESIRISHILIDTGGKEGQEGFSQALKQINNIKREIDRGAAFDEMAKKYSNCPSAQNGGDLGYIQRKGSLAKPFLDRAFSLSVGQVSEPVQTEYGYHIIKVTGKKEGYKIAFRDVREKVRQEVLDTEILKLLDRLRNESQIVINR